jgi:hypothetical protein
MIRIQNGVVEIISADGSVRLVRNGDQSPFKPVDSQMSNLTEKEITSKSESVDFSTPPLSLDDEKAESLVKLAAESKESTETDSDCKWVDGKFLPESRGKEVEKRKIVETRELISEIVLDQALDQLKLAFVKVRVQVPKVKKTKGKKRETVKMEIDCKMEGPPAKWLSQNRHVHPSQLTTNPESASEMNVIIGKNSEQL